MVNLLTAPLLTLLLLTLALQSGRVLGKQRNPIHALAVGGGLLVLIMVGVALSLHTLHLTFHPVTLWTTYGSIAVTLTLIHRNKHPFAKGTFSEKGMRIWFVGILIFSFLILPFTHFTGIDTYKWQDLATSIRVENSLPWVVHPLSLLGFTPRSYPSAHPIMLGTLQIMGGSGIESGFGILSVFIAILGGATAYRFGISAFNKSYSAAIFALLYVYAPVFTRYTHWATGRGLFLALFPLLLTALLNLPKKRAVVGLIGSLLLVCLSHKVGLVVSAITLPLIILMPLIPARSTRTTIAITLLPAIALALLIVPPSQRPFPLGNFIGIVRYSLTRFAWLMPIAILGLIAPQHLLRDTPWRRLYPWILIAIPLAFERNMYGALIALPFIVLAATHGLTWLTQTQPRFAKVITRSLAVTMLLFTTATIINRSRIATPKAIYKAAQFLEYHDPEGPFIVHAPGRSRTQIQAYVSGCPRFSVQSQDTPTTINIAPPPPLKGHPRDVMRQWTNYMRHFLSPNDIHIAWYGNNPRHYYVLINGEGQIPKDAVTLYDQSNVKIMTARNNPPETIK